MVAEEVLTDEQLRDYELVVIVSAEADENAVDTEVDNITRLITGRGGTVGGVEKWGKRRLAYPIKRVTEGNYLLLKCQLKPGTGKELESYMRIAEDILRFLLVKLEK